MRMASSPSPSVVPPNGSGEDYAGLWGMVTLSENHSSAINFLVKRVASAVSLWFVGGCGKTLVQELTCDGLFSLNAPLKPFHYIFFRCVWTRRTWVRADAECCGRYQGLSYFCGFYSPCEDCERAILHLREQLSVRMQIRWATDQASWWSGGLDTIPRDRSNAVSIPAVEPRLYIISLAVFLLTSCLSLQLSTRRKKLGMLVWDNKLWKTPEVKTVK